MAKKKKNKRNDSRGYGQVQQPSRAGGTSAKLSSRTHDGVKSLLGKLQNSELAPGEALNNAKSKEQNEKAMESMAAVALPVAPDRFASKLGGIVDRLTELAFTEQQVEQVVVALKYNLTFESALDWLCLHIPTLELPPLFTDGQLRDSLSRTTTSESLTVLKFSAPSISVGSTHPGQSMDHALATPELGKGKQSKETAEMARTVTHNSEEKMKQKEWLLRQYQYEEDEDDEHQEESIQNPPPTQQARQLHEEIKVSDSERPPWADDEDQLVLEEQVLADMKADAYNDANNYMRSKQEIKKLQSDVKKKQQYVNGIRKRIEKSKERLRAKEEAENNVGAQDDDDGEVIGDVFNMFGSQDDEEELHMEEAVGDEIGPSEHGTSVSIPLIDAVVPNQWTGTLPKKVLEDHCRRKKLPRPKFTKLPHNMGFELRVGLVTKGPTQVYVAKYLDFVRGSDLKDYLSLQALYAMDSSLPLYRMFPAVFKDLWTSWQQKIISAQKEEASLESSLRKKRLDHLLTLVETSSEIDDKVRQDVRDSPNTYNRMAPQNGVASSPSKGKQFHLSGAKLLQEFNDRKNSSKYLEFLDLRRRLPMTSYRDSFLHSIKSHAVTILSAETGAGKTTQCPQYILEEALMSGQGNAVQIIVTQPRRVAAVSVAERVCEEMCESRVGRLVGYQIRNETRRGPDTKLLFCTTGVILRRLQDDRSLDGVTHIVVDEVHERQQQTDVLLVALRQLLGTSRPDLKIILMSATLDTELFCSFFGNAPILKVPGRTFPVSNYHLEDLIDATDHVIEEGSRYARRTVRGQGEKATLWVTNRGGEKRREVVDLVSQTDISDVSDLYPDYKMCTRRAMDRVNEEVINYDLIEDVLELMLCRPKQNTTLTPPNDVDVSKGSILVFMPGLGEIRSMAERLDGNRHLRNRDLFEVIPMHSSLSSKDQRKAFLPVKSGCRKIILSTNIAETSVTIPDVVCVIDTGRVREVRRNQRTSTSILVTDWCSRASSKQRAGRAGRVQAGICLKLYSSQTARDVMKASSEPELRRVPLEEVCLSILASGHTRNSMEFLSQAPEPPTEQSVKAAVDVLEEVGAIEVEENPGNPSKRIEKLTALGRHLSRLPVDVRLGKLLIFGALFRCVDRSLTIAASLSSQSPFATFVEDASVAQSKQRAFAHADSDFMTLCNVWEAYAKAARESISAARKFCRSNYLSFAAMREIGDSRRQFLELLCTIGFVDRAPLCRDGSNRLDESLLAQSDFDRNGGNEDIVHAVICAGLYPNVAHLEPAVSGSSYTLYHKKERLFFHKSSVFSRKNRFTEKWVLFHEKFGTQHRVSVATASMVQPFVLLLLGGSASIDHLHRKVVIDGWIEIDMAAQVAVMMKELRKELDILLGSLVGNSTLNLSKESTIQGIVDILSAAGEVSIDNSLARLA